MLSALHRGRCLGLALVCTTILIMFQAILPPDLDDIRTDCLDALGIVFLSADRILYCAQQRQLRDAFISNPIYAGADAKKPR
jgi:hypothetical protein